METKSFYFFLLSLLASINLFAEGLSTKKFYIEWDYKPLPFELTTKLAAVTDRKRVSEMGILNDKIKLPSTKTIGKDSLSIRGGESAILYLLIKNTSNRTIKFSVAPHSTKPGASALGFQFNCLCNGHVYEVGPKETWYRIMLLSTVNDSESTETHLMHKVFEVKK